MTTVAQFRVAAEDLPLGVGFGSFPDVAGLDSVGDGHLLRAVWNPSDGGPLRAILDSRDALLSEGG